MADPATTLVDWNPTTHQCVANTASVLRRFEDIYSQQDFERVQVERGDAYSLLAKKFVAAAAEIQKSIASQNLKRLYLNEDYRWILRQALKDGYEAGRDDAMNAWKAVFDDFLDQMLLIGMNAIENPAPFIVGVAATAVQAYGKDPLADVAPAAHQQLNEWIDRARKALWAGRVPPPPPEIPTDDLAQAKAGFIIDVLTQVLSVIFDPPSAVFAAMSLPEIIKVYEDWQNAEESQQAGFVSVLLQVVCEPDVLGYNLGIRHGRTDVNTAWMVALRITESLPQPNFP